MSDERAALAQQGRRLEYFTIAWNSLEGLVAIGAGLIAGSISLVGFGADSFIEVTSGAALLWRMSGDVDPCLRERREHVALRIVGVCFLAWLRMWLKAHSVTSFRTARQSVVWSGLLWRASRWW